ncbi:MAG: flagellar hook-basal body complex protein FliE [Myxococcota bacterium]|nr:flagellar hook-basal body complex protein FliE [Myxococcota bacterium]
MAVNPVIPGLRQAAQGLPTTQTASSSGADFSQRLESAIRSVSDTQNAADVHLGRMASGEEVDIHTTMIAMQEADIQLRMMVSVRDKVVDAYQQMMSMAV